LRRYEFDGTSDQIVDSQGNAGPFDLADGVAFVDGTPIEDPVFEPPVNGARVLQLDGASVAIPSLTLSGDFTIAGYVTLNG